MIRTYFGSRRGLLQLALDELHWWSGAGRGPQVRLESVRRLVFVCRGNICRSGFAASVAQSLDFPSISFGLQTEPGKPADPGMRAAAEAVGYDLGAHRTAPIAVYEPAVGDLLAVFELDQQRQLHTLFPSTMVAPLGRWARPARTYIHDPYGAPAAFYARSCAVIESATRSLVADIRRRQSVGDARGA
jgi:protein-tyrosine phosphatase